LVSKWETTLGMLGLTKESSNYFSFLENFKGYLSPQGKWTEEVAGIAQKVGLNEASDN
jgi:hypothetical protein